MPRKLALLFRLKYLNGIEKRSLLAEKLGVSEASVRIYEQRLKKKLVTKLKQVSPDRLQFICPECLEARVVEDPVTGERVCANCGYVVEEYGPKMVHTLPFDEGDGMTPGAAYALENPLVFNKSLGGTLPVRQLYRVIARGPEGQRKEVPVRQIKAIHELHDPPLIRRMKEEAERLRKAFGLDRRGNPVGDPDAFSVTLGRFIEKVGSRALFDGEWRRRGRELAEACFIAAVERFNPRARVKGLKPRKRALIYVKSILEAG